VTTPETDRPPQTSAPPRGERLWRWLRHPIDSLRAAPPSAITWVGTVLTGVALAISAAPYLRHPSLSHYDVQALILAITAVSLFVTAQFAREATRESRAQFAAQHEEREARRIESRGRLSLMLAVECAEINHICEEAYHTVLAQPLATPHRTWNIPTPVFNSVTAQIGELDQAAEIVALYSGVSAAVRLGAAWSGMNPTNALFATFSRAYFGNLGNVLDQTAALLPLLKATARDAGISTDIVLHAQSSVQVDRAVEVETGRPVSHPT
jgi:hypothetical protein